MTEPKAPRLDELLAELEATSLPSPGGRTVKEWGELWHVPVGRARALVHLAIQRGRMQTQPTYRPDIARPGRRVQVWLHSFKKKR